MLAVTDRSWLVQKALFERLSTGLVPVAVYDAVPQGASYPYVVIGDEIADNADFVASAKEQRLIYLSVWSIYEGQKEVKEIMGRIHDLLNRQRLCLDEGHTVGMWVLRARASREPDNVTFMGQVTLKIITSQ